MSFDAARAIFNQVDTNRDGNIDRNEFSQWAGGVGGATTYDSSAVYDTSALYGGLSGYESSVVYGSGGYGGSSSYEASSFGSGAGAGYGAGYGGGVTYVSGGNLGYDAGAAYGAQTVYQADAHGIYHDPNPQIIRRPAAAGVQTYTQNIKVRFLQPPPVPPHGPLIIKEVRPPQPPLPPPLRIRQQAPPLPTPPPLVLRERPPQPPATIAAQTVIRRLAALPVPPRSVIIERLPPLPPRPRDIIIERWVPYAPQAKRRTIVQRAAAAKPYPHPRNVIIQYEPTTARVVHQFQRFGVVQANPQAYVQQYGYHLLDANTLVQQARAAGVLEDISAPGYSFGYSAATYGQDLGAFASSSSFDGGFYGAGSGASSYEVVSGGYGAGFESSGSSFESGLYGTGFDVAGTAFTTADLNRDGFLDRAEFNRFFQQGL